MVLPWPMTNLPVGLCDVAWKCVETAALFTLSLTRRHASLKPNGPKSWSILCWPVTNLLTKMCANPSSTYWEILLTEGQTDMPDGHVQSPNPLSEVSSPRWWSSGHVISHLARWSSPIQLFPAFSLHFSLSPLIKYACFAIRMSQRLYWEQVYLDQYQSQNNLMQCSMQWN